MPHVISAERIGMEKGMLTETRENVLEAPDARFSKDVPEDVFYKKVRPNNCYRRTLNLRCGRFHDHGPAMPVI